MRKPREIKPDATYHITATINREEKIFNKKEAKDLFLEVTQEAKDKYKFELTNFCIVKNEIQFILKPIKEDLSKIMQWLLGVFAMRYNKKYNLRGHLWYDRFKSKIIETVEEIEEAFKRISEKPIIAKLVKKAKNYKYCGISFIIKGIFDLIKEPPKNLLNLAINY